MGQHRLGQLYVALAALAWSTAGVFQRQLDVSTPTQIAGRAVFAFVAICVIVGVQERGNAVRAFRSMGRVEFLLAALMATAMALFIFALNRTSVANVLFMQALAPFVAVVLGWFFLRERPSQRTWLATFFAAAGVFVMAGTPGGGPIVGLLAALGMAVAFGTTIVLVRHQRHVSVAPAMALSQVFVVLGFGAFTMPSAVSGKDLLFLMLLGFGQQGLGQLFFSLGGRMIPATEVAVITLLEVVAGPLLVWLAYAERPRNLTLVGGAIVLAAVLLQATERDGS